MVAVASNKKVLNELDWRVIYSKPRAMATHMQTLQKDQNGNLLVLAVLKGEGYGQYYSVIDKKPVLVPKKTQYFLLPWENEDNPDDYYLYSHHIALSGIVLRVPKKEVQVIGFN
tara:strand:- start:821 stop:1162 length:342 start_codon:yes stop_codon:yes gene_type:complete